VYRAWEKDEIYKRILLEAQARELVADIGADSRII
jgi:hypothetical protein